VTRPSAQKKNAAQPFVLFLSPLRQRQLRMAGNVGNVDPSLPPELWPWQCEICTLLNDAGAAHCAVCETRRPGGDAPTASVAVGTTPAPREPPVAPASPPPAAAVAGAKSVAGLSEEERRARAEELRLKRRKKEEERALVMQQYESDRRAREQPAAAGPGAAALQAAAAAAAATAAGVAAGESPLTRSGTHPQGADDHGSLSSSACAKTGSAEEGDEDDMDEGDGTMLAPGGMPGFGGGRARGRGQALGGIGGGFGSGGRKLYGGTPGADWRFGPRQQVRRPGDKYIGPNGELVTEPASGIAESPHISDGGAISGGVALGGSGSSPANPAGGTQAERRAAALAAIERRNALNTVSLGGSSAAPISTVASSSTVSPAATPTKAASPVPTKKQREAEQRDILARIAAEREDYKELHKPVPSTAGLAAVGGTVATECNDVSDDTAMPSTAVETAAVREARLRTLANGSEQSDGAGTANLVPEPATVVSDLPAARVPGGQLGSGSTKKERAAERQRILQEMQDDRSTYSFRHAAAASHTSGATAVATMDRAMGVAPPTDEARQNVGAASTSGWVRLTVRCAESGRSFTTTAFATCARLADVRTFAAAELHGASEEAAEAFSIAEPFAQRASFAADGEEMQMRLLDLGLCPSATLLLQRPGLAWSGGTVRAEDAEQRAVSGAQQAAAVATGGEEAEPRVDSATEGSAHEAEARARATLGRPASGHPGDPTVT